MKNKKTNRRDAFMKSYQQYAAPIYKPLPIIFSKGRGIWLYDVDGKKYLDCLSTFGAVNQGHCHPKIFKALKQQARTLTVCSGSVHNNMIPEFLMFLCELTNFGKALLMNSGSEAVEAAIKLMRKWGYVKKGIPRGKAEIIVFEGNYHGRTTGIIGFSTTLESNKYFGPYSEGFKIIKYGDADILRDAINKNTCGVLIEPIQCENGLNIPPIGYLKEVENICKEKNVLLCIDEIQTGLGRCGTFFCYQQEKVSPDIVTIAKSLSGGFLPISAVLGKAEVIDTFSPGDHGGTFVYNPIAAAVAKASLEVIKEEKLVENSSLLGAYLLGKLKENLKDSALVEDIYGRGLLIGIKLKGPAEKYCEQLWTEGIFCKTTYKKTVIRIMPPLVIKKREVHFLLEKLIKCLNQSEE